MSWIPRGASDDLSNTGPSIVDDSGDAGTSEQIARDDHVHALGPLQSLTFVSPDGTLWEFTVDNAGALTTSGIEVDARITEDGNLRVTETGVVRVLEG